MFTNQNAGGYYKKGALKLEYCLLKLVKKPFYLLVMKSYRTVDIESIFLFDNESDQRL